MSPWWLGWYEPPTAPRAAWRGVEDAFAWETGWRWCDGFVRCVAVVFAASADAARARVVEVVGPAIEWRGQPIAMWAAPPNSFRGAEAWWARMTSRAA